jgi:hypothetical membrane protein
VITLRKIAGLLILTGAIQLIVCMIIAETLYNGYSAADNYISDLGVGPSAMIFNASMILFGLMTIGGAYYIMRAFHTRLTPLLFAIAGIAAIGVGIFTEDYHEIHLVMSVLIFLFGALSAISTIKLEKSVMRYVSALLGLTGLIALALAFSGNYLGLGPGGMERMIAYPLLLWTVGFGGYLIGLEDKQK